MNRVSVWCILIFRALSKTRVTSIDALRHFSFLLVLPSLQVPSYTSSWLCLAFPRSQQHSCTSTCVPYFTYILMSRGCPEWIYEIMLECWAHEASNRPTFKDLYVKLDRLEASPTPTTPLKAPVSAGSWRAGTPPLTPGSSTARREGSVSRGPTTGIVANAQPFGTEYLL